MADDVIKESDLIQSDGSIDKITQSLELLIDSYGDMVAAIKKGSSEMVEAIKNMSTSTKEGRAALDDAARAAQRLERAQKEYEFAQTDIGKEVADLKQLRARKHLSCKPVLMKELEYISSILSTYIKTCQPSKELLEVMI